MKTSEQIAAEVLARRDAYLEAREKKVRAAKKYAAAGLLVFAAALAAAGLFRSGLFDAVPKVSLPDAPTSGVVTTAFAVPSGDATAPAGTEKPGTQTQEPTATPAAESTTRKDTNSSAAPVGGASTEESKTAADEETPATRREPETAAVRAPDAGMKQPSVPVKEPPEKKNQTAYQYDPTVPHEPSTEHSAEEKNEPATNGNPSAPPAEPTTNANPAAEPPTQTPKDTAAPEETLYLAYVVYDGAVYAAENAVPAAVPAGAKTLAQKDAVVVRYDGAESYLAAQHGDGDFIVIADAEIAAALLGSSAIGGASLPEETGSKPKSNSATTESDASEAETAQITLLALPGDAADARIGVTLAGIDGMLALAYVGTEEAWFSTEEAG